MKDLLILTLQAITLLILGVILWHSFQINHTVTSIKADYEFYITE